MRTALDASLGRQCQVRFCAWAGVFEGVRLTSDVRELARGSDAADLVLATWNVELAAQVNNLGYFLRHHAQTPLIALSLGAPSEEVAALAAGADSVVTPPVYPVLLRARVRGYRRLLAQTVSATPDDDASHDVRTVGRLRLDRTAHRVYAGDEEVELTAREFALLDYLVDHRGELRTRDQILDHVWGIHFDTGTNMVDVYMHFLRKKLSVHDLGGLIQTVRGKGYRMEASD